jgi:hypothetical protein
MRTTLLMLAMLAMPALAAQTVWKWVDANGVTHYSDRAMPGATKIELNVAPATTVEPSGYTTPRTQEQSQPAGPPYRNFEIWKPAQDETIPNTGGAVQINVRVDPSLRNGHTLQLMLNGRPVADPALTTDFSLSNIARGTHSAKAVIRDRRGVQIQETQTVQFHVRQESIANPPVGPSLRSPPKPRTNASNKLPTTQPSYASIKGQPARINPATNLPAKSAPAPRAPGKP